MLTASRSQEVRGARWDEIDLDKALWIIPAERMKMTREHRVPLGEDALSLLRQVRESAPSFLVFPAPRGGELSDMTLSKAMRSMNEVDLKAGGRGFLDRISERPAVPHGLRSTFRDWVSEVTHFPGELAEMALAHKISSNVEAAYRRGDMVEKRRQMMQAWADFLHGRETASNVVALNGLG